MALASQLFTYTRSIYYASNNTFANKNISINNILSEIGNICKIVSDTSLITELRSTALAILCRVHLLHFRQATLPDLIPQFLSSLGSQQMEIAEKIFFYAGVPSIERMRSVLSQNSNASTQPLHDFFQSIPIKGLSIKGDDNIHLFILNSLKDEETGKVLGCEWPTGACQQSCKSDIIRVTMLPRLYNIDGSKYNIDSNFIANVIKIIIDILKRKDNAEWRALTTLSRLFLFNWIDRNGKLKKNP